MNLKGNLKRKTRPKQLLDSLGLAFPLPAAAGQSTNLTDEGVGEVELALEPDDRKESSRRDVLEHIEFVDLFDQSVDLGPML